MTTTSTTANAPAARTSASAATHDTAIDDPAQQTDPSSVRIHWTWLAVWAFLTTFTAFEVVKHGYVNGAAADAALLTATAVGFFVAPDLTFLIGAGQPAAKGSLPTRAVPWYNTMHRMWIPLTLTPSFARGREGSRSLISST